MPTSATQTTTTTTKTSDGQSNFATFLFLGLGAFIVYKLANPSKEKNRREFLQNVSRVSDESYKFRIKHATGEKRKFLKKAHKSSKKQYNQLLSKKKCRVTDHLGGVAYHSASDCEKYKDSWLKSGWKVE